MQTIEDRIFSKKKQQTAEVLASIPLQTSIPRLILAPDFIQSYRVYLAEPGALRLRSFNDKELAQKIQL